MEKLFADDDIATKKEEQDSRLATITEDNLEDGQVYEDQIAQLMFVPGSSKEDPPLHAKANLYTMRDEEKVFKYNYFVGKTATGKLIKANLNPLWCEDIFELKFVECCRLQPETWFHVPLGSSDLSFGPPSKELLTEVRVKFQQENKEFCLVNSVASALFYLKHYEEAEAIHQHAEEISVLPGNVAFLQLIQLMQDYIPKLGGATIYNRRRRKQKARIMTMEDLIIPSTYLTLVQPISNDGGADNVVTVIFYLFFYTRNVYALKVNAESLHWICGKGGLCRLGPIYRFDQSVKCPSYKNNKLKTHW